ncbi:MAG: FAD-dependent oxidoreductase, partial [Candidatus Magasanikbacteria bacterium]|nr:FAD-dependent oxidoreductase [Candidatus Magasanikbacteria bacterium]
MTNEVRDIIIIGSGPAGYTAAIYAGRADLRPLVIEGSQPGGQLTTTTLVENFPGFPDGVMGPELMERMRAQAKKFGAEFLSGEVTGIKLGIWSPRESEVDPAFAGNPVGIKKSLIVHKVFIGDKILQTHTLIIASGSSPKYLGLPSEKKYIGRGVSTCATCDGAFFRGKKVLVVGGGDSAAEEAIFLTKFASSVTVIHRRDTLKASKAMQEKIFANKKINFIWHSEVIEVLGDGQRMTGVKISARGACLSGRQGSAFGGKDNKTGKTKTVAADGMFLAIGHIPNTKFIQGQLKLDKFGYIKTNNLVFTSVPGVFAAGDIGDRNRWWQAVTSAASGSAAALEAERF